MGGSWDISDMDSEPGKSKWWAKKNLEEMPHMCMGFLGGLDSREDACNVGGECNSATLPESAHVSIYIYWTLSSCYMHSVFLHMCSVSLILYSQRFLPLFVLAMIIPLRCLQETKTDYLPFLLLLPFLESKQEAGYKFLNWSPPILDSGNAERRLADCKFVHPGAHPSPTSVHHLISSDQRMLCQFKCCSCFPGASAGK